MKGKERNSLRYITLSVIRKSELYQLPSIQYVLEDSHSPLVHNNYTWGNKFIN